MLILTRKAKQSIRIGDEVTITIHQIKGKSVKIGIEAPREISVVRGELEDRDSQDCDSQDCDVDAPATLPLSFLCEATQVAS